MSIFDVIKSIHGQAVFDATDLDAEPESTSDRLLTVINEQPGIKFKDLCLTVRDRWGIQQEDVQRWLMWLQRHERITFIGLKNGGGWHPASKEQECCSQPTK